MPIVINTFVIPITSTNNLTITGITVNVYDNSGFFVTPISTGSYSVTTSINSGDTHTFSVSLSPNVPYAQMGYVEVTITSSTGIQSISPTIASGCYFQDSTPSQASSIIDIYWNFIDEGPNNSNYFSNTQSNATGSFNVPFTTNASCLIEDTLVLTDHGYVKVQDLKNNDILITSDGHSGFRSVPIKEVIIMQAVSSPDFDPFLFKAGCFSENYPPMDTYLSPHHCILINDKWIDVTHQTAYSDNKSRWTNGAHLKAYNALSDDIQQIKYADNFNYYHIHMPNYMTDHLIINNGLIVESYGIDYKGKVEIVTDSEDTRLFQLLFQ